MCARQHGCIIQRTSGQIRIFSLNCKQWTCDDCRPHQKRKLQRVLWEGAPTHLVTLTLQHDPWDEPELLLNALHRGWRLLRKLIKTKTGAKAIPYAFVIELHKSGHPHMHLLVRMPDVTRPQLKKWWELITKSFEVEIDPVRSTHGVSRYVTKYFVKELQQIEGRRLWGRSRDWRLHEEGEPRPKEIYEETRRLNNVDIAAMLEICQFNGWIVIESGRGMFVALDPYGARDPPLWELGKPVGSSKKTKGAG